jgi:hypothetical protein
MDHPEFYEKQLFKRLRNVERRYERAQIERMFLKHSVKLHLYTKKGSTKQKVEQLELFV